MDAPSPKPEGRYSLDELEFLIPPVEEEPALVRHLHSGRFNPRFGRPLLEEDQRQFAAFLKDKLGLRRHYDGRFSGPCPFVHINGPCDCDSAFYAYPGTGTWYCFCSDHVAKRCGSVMSFNHLGFVSTWPDQLTFDEISSLVGMDISSEILWRRPERKVADRDVRVPVKGEYSPLYQNSDKRQRQPGETLCQEALKQFPKLRDVKAFGRSHINIDEWKGEWLMWTKYSNTWRNPQNANHKRRQAYMGLVPKLNSNGPWYSRDISADDLGDADTGRKRHQAMEKAVKRAYREGGPGGLLGIDNLSSRGCMRYITNVPLPGFIPLEDPIRWLVDALKAIRPPAWDDKDKTPFNPIKGTRWLRSLADKELDENKQKTRVIATSSQPSDLVLAEATAHTMGMATECFNARIFRSQSSDAVLKGSYNTIGVVLSLVDNLEGYSLTKYGRELAREFQSQVAMG